MKLMRRTLVALHWNYQLNQLKVKAKEGDRRKGHEVRHFEKHQGKEGQVMGEVIELTRKAKRGRKAASRTPKDRASKRKVVKTEDWSESDIGLHRQLLQKLIVDEEFGQARIVAKHLTDLQPDDAIAWHLQGVALLRLSDPDSAEACLLKSIEIAGDADEWDCCQMSGVKFLRGELEAAIDWCRRAVEMEPDKLSFQWKLMKLCRAGERLDDAVAVGREALRRATEADDEIKTRGMLANLHLCMSAFDEAEEQLSAALKLYPGNPQLWLTLGRCFSRQNRQEEALTAFRHAAEIESQDAVILYNIGDAYLGLGRPEEALEPLLRAVRLDPDYRLAHYDLSLAFFELKRYPEAEAESRAALRDDPEMAVQGSNLGLGATGNLGITLLDQGRMEEAEACFRRNLDQVAPTYFNLGLTMFRMKRFNEALVNFLRALELSKDDPECYNLIVQTYEVMGEAVEAEQSLRRAIEIDPNYAMGHYDLGVILAKREGRGKEAYAAFERALKIDPNLAPAYYGIACLNALSKKTGPALSFLEKALRKGFREIALIEKDPEWDGLRKNTRFVRLLEEYRELEGTGTGSKISGSRVSRYRQQRSGGQ